MKSSFNWEKKGLVFVPQQVTEHNWFSEFAQAPATLQFDDYLRVYFSCRPAPDQNGQYLSYSAFVNLDKNDFFKILQVAERPIIELGDKGTFDEFGTYPVSVIEHEGKYIAYYAGWTRCESVPFNVAIGMALSEDGGCTFRKLGSGPVISYSLNEPFIISGPKIRKFNGSFYMFYIAGSEWILHQDKPEPVYKIRMATSEDGYVWKKHDLNLIDDKLGKHEAQASPDVIFHNDKYHMFFCYRYPTDFRSKERGYRIGYASSVDLINWVRDDERAGIDVSEEGWDSEMISYPHVFELNGKLNMFYLGNQVGRYGFGWAQLNGTLE